MIPESPKKTPELAETVVSNQPAGDPPTTPTHETVSLLGLARATTSGGQHFVPPSVEELGAALPQFAIEELIGAGGMGAVYRVRQKDLDRAAALKVLPRELAERPDFQERFMREAKALAGLNHPHLVTVYEVGQTNGWCWLLMELVDGVNLREVMSTGRLSPEQALKIVPQLCDALQYAHDQGVVHRDIKPENILIDTQGRLKLTDFGLAKIITKDHQMIGGSLTQTGAILGTMHYMAPEQFEGAKVDHRADIYAVGVVLYEMLTGSLPLGRFQPPSRQIAVDVRIDEVVLKALDKDPEQRYQRASEVRSDVERVRSDAKHAPAAERSAPAPVGKAGKNQSDKIDENASTDGDSQGIRRFLDRRIFRGMVMAISGISVVGMCVFNEFYPRFYALWVTRDKIGNVPYSADEIGFALSQLPDFMTIVGALAGLAMMAGGWSLLTLRSQSLVVLGGIASFALVPVALLYPLRDGSEWPYAFIIALPVLYIPFFSFRISKIADCFDPQRLASISYAYPSRGKARGLCVLLSLGLLLGIGLGYNEALRPLKREIIDLGKSYASNMETLELFGSDSGKRVSWIRSEYSSLDEMLNNDSTMKKSLIEAGWLYEQHKKLDTVISHLEAMRSRKTSAALKDFSSRWSMDTLTWDGLVRELYLEGVRLVEGTQSAIKELESKNDPIAVNHPKSLKKWTERLSGISRDMGSIITQDHALLGVVTLGEYKKQREVVLSLSNQTLDNPQLLAGAHKQLTSVWYSQSQAKYLLMTARQVIPYDTDMHKWLETVLRSRTTTTGLVFESEKSVEQ